MGIDTNMCACIQFLHHSDTSSLLVNSFVAPGYIGGDSLDVEPRISLRT